MSATRTARLRRARPSDSPLRRQRRSGATGSSAGTRARATGSCSPTRRWCATSPRARCASCRLTATLDDLASAGLVALLEAIDRFDPAKGASFEQYAWTRVAGALVDELRKQDWASRSVRREGRRIERARDSFFARDGTRADRGRSSRPSSARPSHELRVALEDIDRSDVASLNAPARGADDVAPVEVGETIQAPEGEHDPEASLLGADRNAAVRAAIARLSERERHVLSLVHVAGASRRGDRPDARGQRVARLADPLRVRGKLKHQLDSYDTAAAAS